MKPYQTPEIYLSELDFTDVLTESTAFVKGAGSDNANTVTWWIPLP